MRVYFSVLSYNPSFISGESINIGVLFQCQETKMTMLEVITKWQRIKSFDDELNIELFKAIVYGIQDEVKNSFLSINRDLDIFQYASKFVNELKFSNIKCIDIDNIDEFIKETKKIYLRYDYDKKERLSKETQTNYIKKLLRNSKLELQNGKTVGEYNESIKYDYIVKDYAFKIFAFDNKDLSKLINTAKAWAFNANEMKAERGINTIFIYDCELENIQFKIIYKILEKYSCKVISAIEAIDYILELEQKEDAQESFFRLSI